MTGINYNSTTWKYSNNELTNKLVWSVCLQLQGDCGVLSFLHNDYQNDLLHKIILLVGLIMKSLVLLTMVQRFK